MNGRLKKIISDNVPFISRIFFITALFSAVFHISFVFNTDFADFFNRYISSVFRTVLAKITAVVPFSVAEAFLLFLPMILVFTVKKAFEAIGKNDREGNRTVIFFLSLVALLYSIFALNFAAGYNTSDLADKLGLVRKDLSTEELTAACEYLVRDLDVYSENLEFEYGGASVMPYSNSEMVKKLNDAYEKGCEKYSFISKLNAPVKQIALSEPMTYTHISGVYSFFTGEANLNVNYPDFVLPYTAAHEMAHQRGIAREDEANFVAYLICMESEDDYIKYSATLNMYEYVSSALSKADKAAYSEIFSNLDVNVKNELYSYSNFFDKYRESKASEVTETINDKYLTVQGTEGTKSYGMVVDLFAAYIASN